MTNAVISCRCKYSFVWLFYTFESFQVSTQVLCLSRTTTTTTMMIMMSLILVSNHYNGEQFCWFLMKNSRLETSIVLVIINSPLKPFRLIFQRKSSPFSNFLIICCYRLKCNFELLRNFILVKMWKNVISIKDWAHKMIGRRQWANIILGPYWQRINRSSTYQKIRKFLVLLLREGHPNIIWT